MCIHRLPSITWMSIKCWIILYIVYFVINTLLQIIIRDELNADSWFDYGTFCLYVNDVIKVCMNKSVSMYISFTVLLYNLNAAW